MRMLLARAVTMPQTLVLLALAATLLTTGIASAARRPPLPDPPLARGVKGARWMAVFEARQTVAWKLPRSVTLTDCYHVRWLEGNGQEVWQISSRAPTKMYVIGAPDSPLTFRYGTWSMLEQTRMGIDAGSMIQRSSFSSSGSNPGRCGGEAVVDDPPERDCGARLPAYGVSFIHEGSRLEFSTHKENGQTTYQSCLLNTPPRYVPGSFKQPPATAARERLLSGRGTVRITGTDSSSDSIPQGSSQLTTSARVTWTLTLMDAADYERYERQQREGNTPRRPRSGRARGRRR
ncbi:hypothetical protein [Conexibacter sp. CPCC 206217]|uniref:hypothetical protein n=1 Tax=Conexibacter sp. CPCC 206217 TaxID=3064574 RepID=UPI002718EC84|nr:hypothetical protein [Conexibacter sp. CPCC 206217]MDO8210865.1 hypothetical protein [Conexibacter sp. CPCC 206217]